MQLLVRRDWLWEHAEKYPDWHEIVKELITYNAFYVIPPKARGFPESQELSVIEPFVKGAPATFKIEDGLVICTNYPGSIAPMSPEEFVQYVLDIDFKKFEAEELTRIQRILAQDI